MLVKHDYNSFLAALNLNYSELYHETFDYWSNIPPRQIHLIGGNRYT